MSTVTETGRLNTRERPSLHQQAENARRWGWWYYAEHWLAQARSFAVPVFAESVLTPLLYLVATGLGLATLVNEGVGQVDGVRYLVFAAPALLVSTVMMSATNEGSYPVLDGFKWHRLYWGASASPLSPAQIASGQLLGMGMRLLFQATLFWVVLIVGGATHGWHSAMMVPIAVLSGWAFGAPLSAYAATLQDDGLSFNFVFRFIVMPMTLFAGTFYPLSVMPVYLQWVGWISPIWHGSQLARRVSYGMVEPTWLTVVHVVFLVSLAVGGWLLAQRNFTRRLTS